MRIPASCELCAILTLSRLDQLTRCAAHHHNPKSQGANARGRGRRGGMRCPQCGNDTEQGAAFCSRCGTRMFAPKPAAVREYALALFRPSLWYYANGFLIAGVLIALGGRLLYVKPQPP